jgi:hypothetical protein
LFHTGIEPSRSDIIRYVVYETIETLSPEGDMVNGNLPCDSQRERSSQFRRLPLNLNTITLVIVLVAAPAAFAAEICPAGIDVHGDSGSSVSPQPGGCAVRKLNGMTLPDPVCTPDAFNPSVTVAMLRDSNFHTWCLRDKASSASAKAKTYSWYGVTKPMNNKGAHMVCELDHLVPLEIGGADTLDNIWPECGPPSVVLNHRYWRPKDKVEDRVAKAVRDGTMTLVDRI